MTELYSREPEETNSFSKKLNEVLAPLKGGARLWSEIIKAVEGDVRTDNTNKRKGIESDSRDGISKIAELINANLDTNTQIDSKAFDHKNIQDMYSFLKKEVNNVRILKTGKTTPEKIVGVVKMAGRFVGGLFAQALGTVGSGVKFAGELVHITPAAYLLNRLPRLSKIETVAIEKGTVSTKLRKVRKNFLEILGDSIQEGALFISSKSNAPIWSKALYNLPKSTTREISDSSAQLKRFMNTEALLSSLPDDAGAKTAKAAYNIAKKPKGQYK